MKPANLELGYLGVQDLGWEFTRNFFWERDPAPGRSLDADRGIFEQPAKNDFFRKLIEHR